MAAESASRKVSGISSLLGTSDGSRQVVCVMGLGFVGSAMAAVVGSTVDHENNSVYDVIGVELANEQGLARADAIKNGIFPFECTDNSLQDAVAGAVKAGNLTATTDESAFALADVIIIDIPLDVRFDTQPAEANFDSFKRGIRTIGKYVKPGALIIVETTVPPGTCDKVVSPVLAAQLAERSLGLEDIFLSHSFERVMPGPNYLASIRNYWRAYAGLTDEAAERCAAFLTSIINVEDYPLVRLSSMAASETAKVLENSYRAINIALIDEWSVFAEKLDLDLFEILEAIQKRPTHKNIMRPGLGVGGYCLTKDIFFGEISLANFHAEASSPFKFTRLADQTNQAMPSRNLQRVEDLFDGSLQGKKVLMLGIAYRSEVGDTRYAAPEKFFDAAVQRGCEISTHDPFVGYWMEKGFEVPKTMPDPDGFDLVVFCVPHQHYRDLDIIGWLGDNRPMIYDCDGVLSRDSLKDLRASGIKVGSTGRGPNA